MKIIKRDGTESVFDKNKIEIAINKANLSVNESDRLDEASIKGIAKSIELECESFNRAPSVEEVQDMVEKKLVSLGYYELSKSYITYRYQRMINRSANVTDERILSLVNQCNEDIKQENSNKNPTIISTQRDYIAGETSKDMSDRLLLPEEIVEADREGIAHFHDKDYFICRCHNCCLINLDDMLQNGTVISETKIEKPHSFATACNIATQIIAQVASSQYGGQSISLTHLAPFVDISRQKIRKEVEAEQRVAFTKIYGQELIEFSDNMKEAIDEIVETRVKEEVKKGVQTIQYQILTLLTTNGQTPFVTEFMYLGETNNPQTKEDLALIIEETLKQRMQGVMNEKGVWITPAFPKIIYVLEEDNIHEDSKYFYLTELAAKCTAKRMVPDYISEKKMKEYKEGNCFAVMGCRSNLAPWKDENGNYKFYGRFNQGVVTINLIDVALSSGKDFDKFWKIFDERLELCYRALMCRHNRLKGTSADVAPILWRHGALARLDKGETIDSLLYGGYSSISLGYAGLYECVKYMTDKSHSDPEATPFAIEVMQYMNDKCEEWKKATNIGFSIYGSPIESTTYKFQKCLQRRFGIIPGITDKNYITNSYHLPVTEEINAFDKLEFESKFQHLSTGGAISYVEVPNMQNNIPAVLEVMKFIYENIMYAELNTKSDYCHDRDQEKMNVARRTCGYIGSQFWNQGRTQEIKDRVLHL